MCRAEGVIGVWTASRYSPCTPTLSLFYERLLCKQVTHVFIRWMHKMFECILQPQLHRRYELTSVGTVLILVRESALLTCYAHKHVSSKQCKYFLLMSPKSEIQNHFPWAKMEILAILHSFWRLWNPFPHLSQLLWIQDLVYGHLLQAEEPSSSLTRASALLSLALVPLSPSYNSIAITLALLRIVKNCLPVSGVFIWLHLWKIFHLLFFFFHS